jgi:hypothetical protein
MIRAPTQGSLFFWSEAWQAQARIGQVSLELGEAGYGTGMRNANVFGQGSGMERLGKARRCLAGQGHEKCKCFGRGPGKAGWAMV